VLGEGGFIVESDGLALNAIQNFGAMDILCTDKTGTLTQNKVILERHLDVHGHEDIRVLEYAWLNSFNQTGLKNLLDVAALEYAQQHEIVEKLKHYRKIDEIPFDFVRRRMSVIVSNGGNQNLLVCKGAIEELLPLCVCADDRKAEAKGGVVPFTTEMRKEVRRVTRRLNQDGLRALAVAYKWLPPEDRTYSVDDEKELVLSGYVAFLDPPKETAREAIAALREHGVAVKIITGDNEVVTRKICKEVDLPIEHAMLGKDVEELSAAQLEEAAELTTIFALAGNAARRLPSRSAGRTQPGRVRAAILPGSYRAREAAPDCGWSIASAPGNDRRS
jgi:Mg2+-importing ATPase